jgi:hypothetical protein
MQKEFKLRSDGGDPDSKKCKQGYGEVWHSLVGVWSQAVSFAVGNNLAGHSDYVLIFNLLYKGIMWLYFQNDFRG